MLQLKLSYNYLRIIALATAACIPIFSSFLLVNVYQTSGFFVLLGVLFAVPTLLSIKIQRLLNVAQQVNLILLLAIVLLCSENLWSALLNQQPLNLSLQLLILLLSLLYAAAIQLLRITDEKLQRDSSMVQELERVLGGQNLAIAFSIGLILCNLLLLWLPNATFLQFLVPKILQRGIIPPITITLFFWGFILVLGHSIKLYKESLSFGNERSHLTRTYLNYGKQQNEYFLNTLWQQFEAFYIVPRYINSAIPIIGFIGTVLGISLATEGLSAILPSTGSEFGTLLGEALTPLGIAFDTTLIALSLSIVLGLLTALVYRFEERKLIVFIERHNIEKNKESV